jgi:hypothetical protein
MYVCMRDYIISVITHLSYAPLLWVTKYITFLLYRLLTDSITLRVT